MFKMQLTILLTEKQKQSIRCWLMVLFLFTASLHLLVAFFLHAISPLYLNLCLSIPLPTVSGRLRESSQPAADPSVLRPGRVQRRAHGEAPGRSAEADPAGGGEAHRNRRARSLQQDLQHPLLWRVHHHEPRGHRPLPAHRRDDWSICTLGWRAAAGGMMARAAGVVLKGIRKGSVQECPWNSVSSCTGKYVDD